VRNSLRMRPDRIVVGEVRGAETLDMLQAMNTGHEGSLSTVHANSPEDAVSRVETLASMSDVKIPYEALRDQINGAIDIIVQLERGIDGLRRIVEIASIASRRREIFRLETLVAFEPDPLGAERKVTGRFTHFPLPDRVARRMAIAGEQPPLEFTVAADAARAPERIVD
jgi:pilus assembly protein CpaF